jgi:hypothetical protein
VRIILEDDPIRRSGRRTPVARVVASSHRPSTTKGAPVKKSITIALIAFVLLLVACGGWAVDGARWALLRPRLAPAA